MNPAAGILTGRWIVCIFTQTPDSLHFRCVITPPALISFQPIQQQLIPLKQIDQRISQILIMRPIHLYFSALSPKTKDVFCSSSVIESMSYHIFANCLLGAFFAPSLLHLLYPEMDISSIK